ncbi:MAG: Eco57I restriction-modification methylase domain-containing protein [Verrucomicrobiota bacterium]|nr:Eco57I restriction-modification methylase domain-containing protein [Verrucomicrobiota bacterium]
MPVETGKEKFFAKLKALIAEAQRLKVRGFDEQEPEEATKQLLIEPFLLALGFASQANHTREFKILGDSVDYLLKSDRPLMFLEAKSLLDCPDKSLFDKHREQVLRYIQNYRLSPEITRMEQPVKWILLANFDQLHFIRVNEVAPTFSLKLDDLWPRREELWELLALENLEAGRIDEIYDQRQKAGLDQLFLADLKRWRLLIANGFALSNPKRSLEDITLASQQLLDRFIFCLMLETQRLVEYNKLARAYSTYEVLFGRTNKTFSEVVRESVFTEIKKDFNTELFEQPLLCDELAIDNAVLSAVLGHEPLAPELAAQCGFESGQGERLAFRHLYRYDFSRMSQDVMGAVYERFLAHKLLQRGGRVVIEDTDELRKKEGIYYTPQYIVDYIVAHTLGEKIKPILAEAKTLLGYRNFKGAFAKIRELGNLKVLDPAMGSGSFLLRAFDALVKAYDDYNQECRRLKKERNGAGSLFDADFVIPEEVLEAPLHVLTENIFGVDLDKQAVEVAKLNLWMRYVAVSRDPFMERLRRKPRGAKPLGLLPNLTNNLKRGNSLIADKAVAGGAAFDWEKEFPEIMGGTGNLPVPVGDPPTGTGNAPAIKRGDAEAALTSVPPGGSPAPPKRRGFDVVIGNPPYERIQVMQANSPEAAEFLKASYRVAVSGNFDIYVCFIERGLQLLRANGVFGYICPNKFFQSEYGRETRQLLSDGKHVSRIVNFGHLQIFSQATIYTCLLFLRKTPLPEFPYFKVEDLEMWKAGNGTLPIQVSADSLNHREWNFVPVANKPLFLKINSQPKKLEDVADIFVGLQTSADDVFILDYLGEVKAGLRLKSRALEKEWILEKDLLHPLVSGTDVSAYGPLPHRQFIIFPYKVKGGAAKLIDFKEIQKRFPKTAEYLEKNRAVLEGREEGKFKDAQWYRFGRLQNLTRQAIPKLCVPRLVDRLHAAWDENGEVFLDNVDVGGVTVKPEFASLRMPYLLALLNSRLLRWFFPFVSVPFRGNYFSANRQFLGQLPIKLIDPKKKGEAVLEKEIAGRIAAIQTACKQSQRLPESLQRKIAHTQNRTPCNLAHYLQKDFAAALKPEILIDDVQRAAFVHEIQIESEFGGTGHWPVPSGDSPDGKSAARRGSGSPPLAGASPARTGGAPVPPDSLVLSVTVSDTPDGAPRPLPVLKLLFKDDALRQFIYAGWKQFLAAHSRQKRWTKGKRPEPIYPLLANTLEPLVYFSASAGDNLRAIRDMMKAVAEEAGGADLAAIEAEIAKLDREIDARVYELYGLTPDEIRIVEGAAK